MICLYTGGLLKIDVPYFEGVELYTIRKFDLPKYYGQKKPFNASKLKMVYMDLYDQYALFWSNGYYLPFHDWLVSLVSQKLNFNCISKFSRSQLHSPMPDLIFKDRYIEVETGLKHSYASLKFRLYHTQYFTYVLVPNMDIKRRYVSHLKQFHGRVYSFKQFFSLNSY